MAKSLPHEPVYTVVAKDEDIRKVLEGFAANLGIPIKMSAALKGRVNGKISERPGAFLQKLANVYNIMWYYDGSVLFVYSSEEVVTKIVRVKHTSIAKLKRTLKRLEILDDGSRWQSIPQQKLAYISGPPRFVELASELSQVLDESVSKNSGAFAVEIFPLKYADGV